MTTKKPIAIRGVIKKATTKKPAKAAAIMPQPKLTLEKPKKKKGN